MGKDELDCVMCWKSQDNIHCAILQETIPLKKKKLSRQELGEREPVVELI